ncbi:hypothetical protein [Cyanobium sp. CH-040]|uniref:hypothetical protein n=1 Tax=Cyanobium sp. CH-040 TaxID=2823708 RepID=UPI0020CFD5A8|nr:hypothetical protein [Cyanobium sp. CH-040]MCP9927607.1 hypothetical protein [Cyanobium sp. CH-040]
MIFKRKDSFFLDLSKPADKAPEKSAGKAEPKAASKAAPTAAPKAPAPAAVQVAVKEPAPAAPAPAPAAPAPAAGGQPVLTTAEAIAAELRAAQEARPAPSQATFAPECLNPANAVPSRRRKAGANLATFKAMADEMFRS